MEELKPMKQESRLLTIEDVANYLRLSKGSIRRLMGCNGFPKPITLGKRSIRWVEKDLAEYVESLRGT